MKSLLLVLATVVAPAFAEGDAKGNLDSHKMMVTSNLDKRIESLQKMKTCITGATSHDAMKTCRETHRAEMNALEDAKIDARIQKLQEKKAKK